MLKSKIIVLLICTFIAINSFSQGIQDTVFQIPTVEVSANKIFVKEEAGMKSSEVDSIVLLEKINLSLSELLSENTPIFIKSHGRGALATASFRGTAASHTQVNWNGVNINSPMAGMVDFSLIPVYIIDDINIKHGTASISDQSGGLGGSINIGNSADWNKNFGIKFLQSIGSYKTFDDFLQINGGNKKVSVKTRLYYNQSANNYTFINRGIGNIDPVTGDVVNPMDTNSNADYQKYGLLQEVYFRPNLKNIFSVKYWGQWADRTIPRATSYEGPNNSNLNKQTDIDHKLVADWKRYFENSKLVIRSGYSEKQLDYSVHNNVSGVGMIPAIYSISNQKSLLNSATYNYNINDKLSIKGQLTANFHSVNTTDTVQKTGYNINRQEYSSFFSIHKNIKDRLNINLMIRQDFVDNNFIPFIPYLGFDLRLIKNKMLFLKGNIGRNYHKPSLNDLYWQPGGNPDLLPENGISGELGLEFIRSFPKLNIKSELTTYRSDIKNWIIWIPNYKGYWEPRNIKRVLSQGVECNVSLDGNFGKLKYKALSTYSFTSSINYGDSEIWGDESYRKQLVYVPLHSYNLMLKASYKGFFISYQHNSFSERHTTSSNDITRRDWLYPYFMNDLMFGKDFKAGQLSGIIEFKIYNLFNETYHSVLYRPMPGRNYILQLSLSI